MFPLGASKDFEVLPNEHVVILNYNPNTAEGHLFLEFNQEGQLVNSYGDNSLIQPILKETEQLPIFSLTRIGPNKLVVISELQGQCFIFDRNKMEEPAPFSIQAGPEWEAFSELQNNPKVLGHYTAIYGISMVSNEKLFIGFDGEFKNNKTIGMIYSDSGQFMHRVFGNETFSFNPTSLSFINDSTVWMYNGGSPTLIKTTFEPYRQ